MTIYIILYNMIIEDECKHDASIEFGRETPLLDIEIAENKNLISKFSYSI